MIKLAIFGLALFYRLRIAQAWSRLYQLFFERAARKHPLRLYSGLDELVYVIHNLKWKADSVRELGDAYRSPEAIQYLIDQKLDAEIGDCDEFAHYAAAVVGSQAAIWTPGSNMPTGAEILSILWHDDRGYGGHNVALIKRFSGRFSWMDYGQPSYPVLLIAEVVKQVMSNYAPKGRLMLTIRSEPWTLRPIEVTSFA